MAEPETIANAIERFFSDDSSEISQLLSGKKVLVTAGPTYEAIDPVHVEHRAVAGLQFGQPN